jgi:type IV secretion system protein VirB4
MGMTEEVLGNRALRANEVLMRFGGQWMFQSEAQRVRVTSLPQATWRHAVSAWLDQCRRYQLLVEPGCYETNYYMTLTYRPVPVVLKSGLGWFVSGPQAKPQTPQDAQARTAQAFVEQADYFMSLLAGILAECRPLTPAETFTYLNSTVSHRWQEVGTLACWDAIDVQLATSPFRADYFPLLGHPADPEAWHVRLCSITGYPQRSLVGVLDTLDLAQVQYRWCVRWQGMEDEVQEGILRRQQHAWVGEEKTLGQTYAEKMGYGVAKVTDTSALNKAAELDAERQETGHELKAFGKFTCVVMTWGATPEAADTNMKTVMVAMESRGFKATVEYDETGPAWFATHPGNYRDHATRHLHSSLTTMHLAPGISAAWRGPETDETLQDLPWLYAMSRGNTLIRLVNHIQELGHFLCLGATRTGKSTLLNILRAAWMQYRNAQAILFDLDGHGRLLTYLLGGAWHELGLPGQRWAPFQKIDDPLWRAHIKEWLFELLAEYDIPRDHITIGTVASAIEELAKVPRPQRTLTTLLGIIALGTRETGLKAKAGAKDVHGVAHRDDYLMTLVHRRAAISSTLRMFAEGGDYDGLFDAATDDLTASPIQTFEMKTLLNRPSMLGPVLRYLLLHVQQQMSTEAPMLLLLDDAAVTWMASTTDKAANSMDAKRRQDKVKEYLQTAAKKLVSVGFSTHTLVEVFGSAFGTVLQEACPARFFFPNADAHSENIAPIYRKLDLTDNAIDVIAKARRQEQFYLYVRELGQQLVSMPHSRAVLDCVARNSAADHARMDAILAREGLEGFGPAWMRELGHEDAAIFFEQFRRAA